jgi:hypothetical protein
MLACVAVLRSTEDTRSLCIVVAACVDKLFDLSSVFGLQPSVQSRCADITIILGLDCYDDIIYFLVGAFALQLNGVQLLLCRPGLALSYRHGALIEQSTQYPREKKQAIR